MILPAHEEDHYAMFKQLPSHSIFPPGTVTGVTGPVLPKINTVLPKELVIKDGSGNVLEKSTGEADPNGVPANAPGAKLDAGKNLVWLMLEGFPRALEEVAQVTTEGAKKYTPHGWATVPNGVDRYMQGMGRHLLQVAKGEIWDNGPGGIGRMHLAQVCWNALAALELQLRELELRNENRV